MAPSKTRKKSASRKKKMPGNGAGRTVAVPAAMAEPLVGQTSVHRPDKAYKNLAFLNSAVARPLRILSEFIEPDTRLRRLRIRNTLVFYGSARALPPDVARAELRAARSAVSASRSAGATEKRRAAEALVRAQTAQRFARYYGDAMDLSARLTRWSLEKFDRPEDAFYVCTGGGPGIMEAANRGARDAGGDSIGFNISLPQEQDPNPYQTPALSFEFHYFFMRKFWFVYPAKALILFPGGFGTLDEMFELLTLVQTQKTHKTMPIVLFGAGYWNEVLNFDAMLRWGAISEDDLQLFRIFDRVEPAFRYLTTELTRLYPPKREK